MSAETTILKRITTWGGEAAAELAPQALHDLSPSNLYRMLRGVELKGPQDTLELSKNAVTKLTNNEGKEVVVGRMKAAWEATKLWFQQVFFKLSGLKKTSGEIIERVTGGGGGSRVIYLEKAKSAIRGRTPETQKLFTEAENAFNTSSTELKKALDKVRQLTADVDKFSTSGQSEALTKAEDELKKLQGSDGLVEKARKLFVEKYAGYRGSLRTAAKEELEHALRNGDQNSEIANRYRHLIAQKVPADQAKDQAIDGFLSTQRTAWGFLDEAIVPQDLQTGWGKVKPTLERGINKYNELAARPAKAGEPSAQKIMDDIFAALSGNKPNDEIVKDVKGATSELIELAKALNASRAHLVPGKKAEIVKLIEGPDPTVHALLGRTSKDTVADGIISAFDGANFGDTPTLDTAVIRLKGMLDRNQLAHIPGVVPTP